MSRAFQKFCQEKKTVNLLIHTAAAVSAMIGVHDKDGKTKCDIGFFPKRRLGSELSDRPHARTYVDIGVPKVANFSRNLFERIYFRRSLFPKEIFSK